MNPPQAGAAPTRALFDNGLPSPREALARVFGHADFRGRQGEVITMSSAAATPWCCFPPAPASRCATRSPRSAGGAPRSSSRR